MPRLSYSQETTQKLMFTVFKKNTKIVLKLKCGTFFSSLSHRSDSNKNSDYIAIFLSLISSFCGQHLKI